MMCPIFYLRFCRGDAPRRCRGGRTPAGDHWSPLRAKKRPISRPLFCLHWLRSAQHAPSFIARASRKIAIPIGSCVGGAAKAKAFALDALIIQLYHISIVVGHARTDPVFARGAKLLRASHLIRHGQLSFLILDENRGKPCAVFPCLKGSNYLEASSIATATATVMPTMGLLPAPIRPIIST